MAAQGEREREERVEDKILIYHSPLGEEVIGRSLRASVPPV